MDVPPSNGMGKKIDIKLMMVEINDIKSYIIKDIEEMMTLAKEGEKKEKFQGIWLKTQFLHLIRLIHLFPRTG